LSADLLDLTVGELLEELAEPGPVPAGGSAAAFSAAMAAALVAMAARATSDWEEAGPCAAQALALRARLQPLARADAEAYANALRALDDRGDDFELGRALDQAAALPLAIAEGAADVAELAVHVSDRCDGRVRGDALAAAALAGGAALAASRLVEINLATKPDDERSRRAQEAAARAARAATRAVEG